MLIFPKPFNVPASYSVWAIWYATMLLDMAQDGARDHPEPEVNIWDDVLNEDPLKRK